MNFYRIFKSSGPDIGIYPQVKTEKLNFNILDEKSAYHINFTVADKDTLWPIPVLSQKAKRTDLISASSMGLSDRLIISEKMRSIISKFNTPGMQFINTDLLSARGKTYPYFICNPCLLDFTAIDYNKSTFMYMDRMFNVELEETTFLNHDIFLSTHKQNLIDAIEKPFDGFRPLTAKKLVIKEDYPFHFFALVRVYGGIGFFISEDLKTALVSHDCTGIVYTNPNDRYP